MTEFIYQFYKLSYINLLLNTNDKKVIIKLAKNIIKSIYIGIRVKNYPKN